MDPLRVVVDFCGYLLSSKIFTPEFIPTLRPYISPEPELPPPPPRPLPKKKPAQLLSDVEMLNTLESDAGPSTRSRKVKGKAVERDPPAVVESGSKRVLQESPTREEVSVKRTRMVRKAEEVKASKKEPDPVYLEGLTVGEETFVRADLVPAIVGEVSVHCS